MRARTNSASAVTTIDGSDDVSNSAEASNPLATETMPAVAAPIAIRSGLDENRRIVVAGITSSATISSTPTILIATAMIAAMRSPNTKRARSGRSPATLTESTLTVAASSGRHTRHNTASATAPPHTRWMARDGTSGVALALAARTRMSARPANHRSVFPGGFDVQRLDDGAFRFTNPHGLPIRPPRRRETSSPDTIVIRNDSLGLAIDCETATAHWHGERIDYDHALMVAMASWDSGDTRPEAGPAAGDWNPS